MIPYPIYQQQQPQQATPFPGMPNYGQPAFGQPAFNQPVGQPAVGQPAYPQAAAPQPYMPTQVPPGAWQPAPVLASQALATNQPKVRGYSPDPVPTTPPLAMTPAAPPSPPASLRLPSPEDLGVGRSFAAPTAPSAPVAVDWNQAHARMRELGVIRFGVTRIGGGVRVSMELPGGRVVDGLGESEAAAMAMAFDWAVK